MNKFPIPFIAMIILLLTNMNDGFADQNDDMLRYALCKDNVEDATVVDSRNNKFAVYIELSKFATTEFSNITAKNIGRKMAILIDNIIVTKPIIRAKIDSGAITSGDKTEEEANILRDRILYKAPSGPCGLIN